MNAAAWDAAGGGSCSVGAVSVLDMLYSREDASPGGGGVRHPLVLTECLPEGEEKREVGKNIG